MSGDATRAAFDHALHFMVLLDGAGCITDINRAALSVAGTDRPAVLNRSFADGPWWADEAARSRVREAVERATAGRVARFRGRMHGPRAAILTYDISITPVPGGDGNVSFLIVDGRDVTEAMWAEGALRASEARFSGIISIASDAIISVDENFQITLYNQGAEATFGHSREEALGQPLDMLLPERFRGTHSQHIRNFARAPVAARRMGERQEIMGLRRDGTEFPAEASISKLDVEGSMAFTVVLRDITERKRVERTQRFLAQAGAILASSLDYETTLASVAELTVPELADWCVVYIRSDDGSVRRLEVAHADSGRRELLSELLSYPLDPRSPHPVFPVLQTGQPVVERDLQESFIRALSHDSRHYAIYEALGFRSLMVVPLVARGETSGAMGFMSATPDRYGADELAVAKDLALLAAMAVDNARLYRDARAAVQARDDLLAVVSHDLGNPLSAIRIGTSLLLRSVPESEHGSGGWQHLEFIRQSVQQMESLINDLLDVKRLEAGRVSLDVRSIELESAIRDVIDVFRPIAEARPVRLEVELAEPLPRVDADYRRIVQVLSNLVSNAIKFTSEGGRVAISARPSSGVVIVSVSDTGPGIAEEHQPRVFDRFWQARREGRTGLGLGLAIARGIIDAHGGRIWLESVPGSGATFLFTLPVAD